MNLPFTQRLLITATAVATIATAGSLYFSMGMGLFPCRLCWFQRILMYPLVVILGVAVWENRAGVYVTALPLIGLGWAIAAYHSYIQIFGSSLECTSVCGTIQFQLFGVLTIPNLSFIAFTLLLGLLSAVAVRSRNK